MERVHVRLQALKHRQLLELAVQAIAELGPKSATAAKMERLLAMRAPVPVWAVNGILTSPDLCPVLMTHLALEDAAAAAVCSTWHRGWRAMLAQRRILTGAITKVGGLTDRAARLHVSDADGRMWASHPHPTQPSVCAYEIEVDGSLPDQVATDGSATVSVSTFDRGSWPYGLTSTSTMVYASLTQPFHSICMLDLGSGRAIKSSERIEQGVELVSTPVVIGNTLFIVGTAAFEDEDDASTDDGRQTSIMSLLKFDAHSLERLSTIELNFGDNPCDTRTARSSSMGAHDGLLYFILGENNEFSHPGANCIRVLTQDGKHLRNIVGAFERPFEMQVREGHLYVLGSRFVGEGDDEVGEDGFELVLHVLCCETGEPTQPPLPIVIPVEMNRGQYRSTISEHTLAVSQQHIYIGHWQNPSRLLMLDFVHPVA